jgi:hypothetical protein
MDNIIFWISSLDISFKKIIIVIALIDFYSLINQYYSNLFFKKLEIYLDTLRLKYLRRIVISGYKTLASKSQIDKSIKKVRELESQLSEESYDFSQYDELYKQQLDELSHEKNN